MATMSGTAVLVHCRSCGAGTPVGLVVVRSRRRQVEVHLRFERADLVWLRLFVEAHRGPFGRAPNAG